MSHVMFNTFHSQFKKPCLTFSRLPGSKTPRRRHPMGVSAAVAVGQQRGRGSLRLHDLFRKRLSHPLACHKHRWASVRQLWGVFSSKKGMKVFERSQRSSSRLLDFEPPGCIYSNFWGIFFGFQASSLRSLGPAHSRAHAHAVGKPLQVVSLPDRVSSEIGDKWS